MVVLLLLSRDGRSVNDLLQVVLSLGLSVGELLVDLVLQVLGGLLSLVHLSVADLFNLLNMVSESLLHLLPSLLSLLAGIRDFSLDFVLRVVQSLLNQLLLLLLSALDSLFSSWSQVLHALLLEVLSLQFSFLQLVRDLVESMGCSLLV